MATAPPTTYEKFDIHADPATLGQRWPIYIKRIENLFKGFKINDDEQKRSLLFYYAGADVSDLFESLDEQGTTYQHAKDRLQTHFCPSKNLEYERFKFREARQSPSESITEYHMRLQKLARHCEFATTSVEVKSQIILGCKSSRLRRKALSDSNMDLKKLLDVARAMELSEIQCVKMEQSFNHSVNLSTHTESEQVNRVKNDHRRSQKHDSNPRKPTRDNNRNDEEQSCYFCGGPYPHKGSCPASNKKCNYCERIGHYEKMCHQRKRDRDKSAKDRNSRDDSKLPQKEERKESARRIEIDDSDSDSEFVFFTESKASSKSSIPAATINISNAPVRTLIDTGTSINMMGIDTYENLPSPPELMTDTLPHVYAYGANQSMKLAGYFKTPISHKGSTAETKFYVTEKPGETLLNYVTSRDLGLISVSYHIDHPDTEKIVNQYEDLFSERLGKLKDDDVELHVDESMPGEQNRHHRVPFMLRKPVEKELQHLLNSDIIEKVEGEPTPWVSPIHVVKKPHKPDQIRICVDMRAPNKAIKRERHITPTIDDITTALTGATHFSKLDLKSGYHQIGLGKKSRKMTVFSTHIGLFRYKRLNFGVNSAAEVFQKKIRDCLEGLDGVINISDDILIHAKSQEEHDRRLAAVLERLRLKNLTLNRDKCLFNKRNVTFYGHRFGPTGISPDPMKVSAIKNAEPPKSSNETRSFLGLTQYCARFITGLASISGPLRMLTKEKQPWTWGPDQQKAFDTIRDSICNDCTNAYFDPEQRTELLVDASPIGLGGILAQRDSDDQLRVVAMASRSLSPVEQRYSQTEREALAIAWGITHFRLYLYANKFKVLTDHLPLVSIFNNPHSMPSVRIERWLMKVMEYDFVVEYMKGSTNPADYSSRHPVQPVKSANRNEKITEAHVNFVTSHALPKTITIDQIILESQKDPVIQSTITAIQSGRWYNVIEGANISIRTELKKLYLIRNELAVHSDYPVVLRGTRLIIPERLKQNIVNIAHEGHQGIVRTKSLLRTKVWFSGIDDLVYKTIKNCPQCQVVTVENIRDPVKMSPLPSGPWLELSCDLKDLPDGKYACVLIDDYSRYPVVEVINSATSKSVIRSIDNAISLFGTPEIIRTDNGPCYASAEFHEYAQYAGFRHRKVTPVWPRANGEAERMMRTLSKSLKICRLERKSFTQEINKYLRNYRATPHPTTGETPSALLFGRTIRTRIPELTAPGDNAAVEDRDSHQKAIMKSTAESHMKIRQPDQGSLQVGDRVLCRKDGIIPKLSTPYDPAPYNVTARAGSMVTASRPGHMITRDISRFKRIDSDQWLSDASSSHVPIALPPSPTRESKPNISHAVDTQGIALSPARERNPSISHAIGTQDISQSPARINDIIPFSHQSDIRSPYDASDHITPTLPEVLPVDRPPDKDLLSAIASSPSPVSASNASQNPANPIEPPAAAVASPVTTRRYPVRIRQPPPALQDFDCG